MQTVKDVWWQPRIERAALKALMQRADAPGLWFLAVWAVLLALAGLGIHLSVGSWWVVPAVVRAVMVAAAVY